MTSRAEGKRKKKAANVIRQRQGRPRKEGATRYKCGKIVPQAVAPNLDAVAARAAMLGITDRDAIAKLATGVDSPFAATENPLDLAKARGWISVHEHTAGVKVAEMYRKAGICLPSLRTQDFDRAPHGHSEGLGNPKAMTELVELWGALRSWPKARAAIFEMCVMGRTPPWMEDRLAGRDAKHRVVRCVHLRTGLRIVARELGTGVMVEQERAA